MGAAFACLRAVLRVAQKGCRRRGVRVRRLAGSRCIVNEFCRSAGSWEWMVTSAGSLGKESRESPKAWETAW